MKRADASVSCYSTRGSREWKESISWCCDVACSVEVMLDIPFARNSLPFERVQFLWTLLDNDYCAVVCVLSQKYSFSACVHNICFHTFDNTSKTRGKREKYNKVKKLFSQLSETFNGSIKQVSAQLKLKKTVRKILSPRRFSCSKREKLFSANKSTVVNHKNIPRRRIKIQTLVKCMTILILWTIKCYI